MTLLSVATLFGLTFLLASVLIIAHRKLFVYEDPRIEQLEQMLPNVNCGACGYPGCHAFAEALVANKVLPGGCNVNTAEGRDRIARFLGVDPGAQEKRIARLACAGGNNVARRHAIYQGAKNCRAATLVAGGDKTCAWGCLGMGDCEQVCQFDAIQMNSHSLPVVDENLCTACGDCVEVCPKDLFSIHPVSHSLWVACSNHEHGDEITQYCTVACTACGKCAMDGGESVVMENNLPVVNYNLPIQAQHAIQRCPTGAIVNLATDGQIIKGEMANKIVRRDPLEIIAR